MKVPNRLKHAGCLALLLLVRAAQAESFSISVGDTVSQGVPGPGAGSIAVVTNVDYYTFTATNGQNVFFEEVSVSNTFRGWLNWQLKTPGGSSVFSGYFEGNHEGRKTLPETGTYTLKVWVGASDPTYVGNYSFRLRNIPADQVFPVQIGNTVTNGVPAAGAGNIEVAGAADVYTFNGTNGQHVFFEELAVSNTFHGWLIWTLRSASNTLVFNDYFEGNHKGRVTLPENGTYALRFQVGYNDPTYIGTYSFRLRDIPADQAFAIQFNTLVTNGAPGIGAGNIEVPGAEDRYTFTGTAGQEVYFENMSLATSLGNWLWWEVRTPSGQVVFSSYFGGAIVGKKTLTETGTYTIRCWVAVSNPSYVGTYAFRVLNLSALQFNLSIGDRVIDGVPAAGAGRIQALGEEDIYTFTGVAGQNVIFETTNAAPAFSGYLRWDIKAPGGTNWFSAYFPNGGSTDRRVLPETGTYTIRVYVGVNNAAYVGTYEFRTCMEVIAWPDAATTRPGVPVSIPFGSFFCNDVHDPTDGLDFELVSGTTPRGGTVFITNNLVVYTPPAGFTGVDTFFYRALGQYGGASVSAMNVQVFPGNDQYAAVVSQTREGANWMSCCLLGAPAQYYIVEQSTNLTTWSQKTNLTAGVDGTMSWGYPIGPDKVRFYRFRKQ